MQKPGAKNKIKLLLRFQFFSPIFHQAVVQGFLCVLADLVSLTTFRGGAHGAPRGAPLGPEGRFVCVARKPLRSEAP